MQINAMMARVLKNQGVSLIACSNMGYCLMTGKKRTGYFKNGRDAVKGLKSILRDSQENLELNALMQVLTDHSQNIWLPEVYRLGRKTGKEIKHIGNEPICLYEACEIVLQDLYQDYIYETRITAELPDINPDKYYANSWRYTPRRVMGLEGCDTLDELVKFIVEDIFPSTMDVRVNVPKIFKKEIMEAYGEAGQVLLNKYRTLN